MAALSTAPGWKASGKPHKKQPKKALVWPRGPAHRSIMRGSPKSTRLLDPVPSQEAAVSSGNQTRVPRLAPKPSASRTDKRARIPGPGACRAAGVVSSPRGSPTHMSVTVARRQSWESITECFVPFSLQPLVISAARNQQQAWPDGLLPQPLVTFASLF